MLGDGYPIPITHNQSSSSLRPHDDRNMQPDSPLLGWRNSLEDRSPLHEPQLDILGSKRLDDDDSHLYEEAGRNSIGSDFYVDYYGDRSHHTARDSTNTTGLSALSTAFLNNPSEIESSQDHSHDQYEREDYPSEEEREIYPPRSSDASPSKSSGPMSHLSNGPVFHHSSDFASSNLNSWLPSHSSAVPSASRPSPGAQDLDNSHIQELAGKREVMPHSSSMYYIGQGDHLHHMYPHGHLISTPASTMSASTTSLSTTSNTPSSAFTSPPPSVYRSNSNLSRAASSSSNQSHAPQYSPSNQPQSPALPYSQPIPRPNRTQSTYNNTGSTYSAPNRSSSSRTPPPSAHQASRTPPPMPSAVGHQIRRQSGLRSSIVSGDVDWRDGEVEENGRTASSLYGSVGHADHYDGGGSHPPISPSGGYSAIIETYPSSGNVTGNLNGRSSRANSQYHVQTATPTLGRPPSHPNPAAWSSVASPPHLSVSLERSLSSVDPTTRSNGSLSSALGRSGSSPGVLSKSNSKGSTVAKMNAGPAQSASLNAPVELPSRMLSAEVDLTMSPMISPSESVGSTLAMGMASTTDEAVHLTQHPMDDPRVSAVLIDASGGASQPGAMRTSWGGQPPSTQLNREWASTVEEKEESENGTQTSTDAELEEDEDVTFAGGFDTLKASQINRSPTIDKNSNARAPKPAPVDERARYSLGSVGSADTDGSLGNGLGLKGGPLPLHRHHGNDVYLPRAQESSGTYSAGRPSHEGTESSEVSEDDYEEEDSRDTFEEEERTAAIVLAEQGGGLIVHAAGMNVVDLDIKPGTTHIVMPNSASPSQVPPFLMTVLPNISETLLALDISCNYLVSLPPALSSCAVLEELNVASNPLRVLPVWLGYLTYLQVLIADSTGINSLPPSLANCSNLRTLGIRKNKMHSLPTWLCLFNNLELLLVAGNPFQGPWHPLLEPLMDPLPHTPAYPPNTPFSAMSTASTVSDGSMGSPYSAGVVGRTQSLAGVGEVGQHHNAWADRDHTITLPSPYANSPSASFLNGPSSSASNLPPSHWPPWAASPSTPGSVLSSRAPSMVINDQSPSPSYFPQTMPDVRERPDRPERPPTRMRSSPVGRPRTVAGTGTARRPFGEDESAEKLSVPQQTPRSRSRENDDGGHATSSTYGEPSGKKSLKKMKSADDMKRSRSGSLSAAMAAASALMNTHRPVEEVPPLPVLAHSPLPSPMPATLTPLPPSRAPSMFGAVDHPSADQTPERPAPKRFISLGVKGGTLSAYGTPAGYPSQQRPGLSPALYEGSSEHLPMSQRDTLVGSQMDSDPSQFGAQQEMVDPSRDKGAGKWGFLKKMSMSKMKHNPPDRSPPSSRHRPPMPHRPATAGSGPSNAVWPVAKGMASGMDFITPRPTIGVSAPPSESSRGGATPTPSLGRAAASNSSLNLPAAANPNLLKPQVTLDVNLNSPTTLAPPSPNVRAGRRRSFLPIDTPPVLNIPIPKSPFLTGTIAVGDHDDENANPTESARSSQCTQAPDLTNEMEAAMQPRNEQYTRSLRSVMAYLRDLADLGPPMVPVSNSQPSSAMGSPSMNSQPTELSRGTRSRSNTLVGGSDGMSEVSWPSTASAPRPLRSVKSTTSLKGGTMSVFTTDSTGSGAEERKYKDDKAKRTHQLQEIVETERTYVKSLQELVDIYIVPASAPVNSIAGVTGRETIIPAAERKAVFNGIESLHSFHKNSFLPALENALKPLKAASEDVDGSMSCLVARAVADIFVSHAAFMRMYSTYINNFDNSLQRLQQWSTPSAVTSSITSPASSTVHLVGLGLSMTAVTGGVVPDQPPSGTVLSNGQRKRMKNFLKRCRLNTRHSQLNLEGYLLLPIQRIPRYKMMLEQLVSCTPPKPDVYDDPIDKALTEIASLANSMNEGKRESESRQKLVQWQARIRGKFPSPLVQPHRRLIMDGRLQLSRVVRKAANYFEVINGEGEKTIVQVECLAPESNPRLLVAILCNDLLVLCKDPSHGVDNNGPVELWAVLRMQTLSQPASMHGRTLRLVDHKAILYFDMPSTSDALTWSRAINMHIPASR